MAEWDGRPQNPERMGWHWFSYRPDLMEPHVAFWVPSVQEWWIGDEVISVVRMATRRYLGPCLTPDEMASALAAARREGAAEMRERAAQYIDRCRVAVLGITHVARAIRALPLDARGGEHG